MKKREIDLSDIKKQDLDETSSFTDLMSKKEKRNRFDASNDDIENIISERKRSTKDLTEQLQEAKNEYNKTFEEEIKEAELDEGLGKTQILELTRQMKFNFNENKKENQEIKKRGISPLNIIGELNLLCIGYYIYLLVFTSYQENQKYYMTTGAIIILIFLLFGISVITNKKVSKFFRILNILTLISFIVFNAYTLLN